MGASIPLCQRWETLILSQLAAQIISVPARVHGFVRYYPDECWST